MSSHEIARKRLVAFCLSIYYIYQRVAKAAI